MIIAVDFDGTLCEDKWPEIGEANLELIRYCIDMQKKGNKIILWTNRCSDYLTNALEWCANRYGLIFDAVNEDVPETIERFEKSSRKIYADIFIDDRMSKAFNLPYISKGDSEK